jgi:YHS domain-containing protein
VGAFVQDPTSYLQAREIEVASFFDPDRAAVLDDSHLARVNYDLYFFADANEVQRFRDDPLRQCGMTSDPVTFKRFRPTRRSPRVEHAGQAFVFATAATHATFTAMPDSFVVPRLRMEEMSPSPAAEGAEPHEIAPKH